MWEIFIEKLYSFLSKLKFSLTIPPITYAVPGYRVTGQETQEILDIIQPGDILLRGYYGYCNKMILNGTIFTHVGLVIDKKTVIHSFSPEVQEDSIIHFCRCDYIAVIRPLINNPKRDTIIKLAINRAKKYLGTLYDFGFNFNNDGKVCCTELLANCFKEHQEELGMIVEEFRVFFFTKKREVIQPDAVVKNGKNNKIVYASRYAKEKIYKLLGKSYILDDEFKKDD